jgi:peptidoglycan/xylan/chitin deacetylase (PgdA/CDA1 family)
VTGGAETSSASPSHSRAPTATSGSGAQPGRAAPRESVKRWVSRTERQVALTIDDGPSSPYTRQVLDVLDRYGVVATFCMVGRQVAAHPDVARTVAERGHLLANHTWDHANLARASAARIADEISRTQDVLSAVTGRTPTFFRAPYGAWSAAVTGACADHGLRALGWSVDPQDWARPTVPVLVSRLLRDTAPGSILLEHDGGGDRSQTVAALTVVLPRLLDEGYRFVTP